MSTLYDTGTIILDDGGANIAQNNWSDLKEVSINDKAAKIDKIVLECVEAASVTGTFYIYSITNGSWANNGASTQSPTNTTGQMVSISVTTLYTLDDTTYYFANNDSTPATKMYLAYFNTDADAGKIKVRILYQTMSLS